MRVRALLLVATLLLPPLAACDVITGPSKVAKGQLYASGDGQYDPYFEQVHREQVASGAWADEAKAARKPIVTALNLTGNASNSTIASSAKDGIEKHGDGHGKPAAVETVSAEASLAKKLAAEAERLEDLKKKGEELKKHAEGERRNMGADKADEKKVDKRRQIERELSASISVTDDLASDARKGAKEADDLAARLRAVYDLKDEHKAEPKHEDEPKPPPPEPKKPAAKKPEGKKPEGKKPAAAPAPAEKPAEPEKKPPPAPKPPDEVFNP